MDREESVFAATLVGRRRNNAVANLVFGLSLGFAEIGEPLAVRSFRWRLASGPLRIRRRLDPDSIPKGCRVLVVPYWITGQLWDINFAEIKRRRPEVRIGTLTGISPFAADEGCEGFHLDAGTTNRRREENFGAIDVFLAVKAQPEGAPATVKEVGMGRLPELRCGPKSPTPLVVLDALKRGWDEPQYLDAVRVLAALLRAIPGLKVLVLGANPLERDLLPRTGVVRLRARRISFARLARLWAQAWATVCHNESFGYSVIENGFSGTRVFTSRLAQLPAWHRPEPLEGLGEHLGRWRAMSGDGRQRAAQALAESYARGHPELCSWTEAARRIAGAFG